jgi:hypothetical protein
MTAQPDRRIENCNLEPQLEDMIYKNSDDL